MSTQQTPEIDSETDVWRSLQEYVDDTLETLAVDVRRTFAGHTARLYVTGAMSPATATPEARDLVVQSLLGNRLLTPGARGRLAASLIRGWVQHRDEEARDAVLAWHRALGSTSVQVGVV